MAFKLTIDNGNGPVDYTSYLLPDSVAVEDSLTVPTLLSFTLVNKDNAFIPPVRSGYCRLFSGKFNVPLATGFVTSVPSLTYLGLGNNIPSFKFQRYSYAVQVTSDEWLLNVKTVPFLPPFVNVGQGQLLAALANILVPNFFDTTTFVASGDIVPYFPYDPTQNWSDLAKQFADSARFRYKVLDRKIYWQPYGDSALGVVYNETKGENTFDPIGLQTPVVPMPPCNDAIVIGDVEAQNNHEDYFVGDGITGNFPLRYNVFEGATSILLQEPWSGDTINTGLWTVQDPTFAISEAGGGLQLQGGDGLGVTYVLASMGVELGGSVNFQHGDFQFVDTCTGIVGGVYRDSTLSQASCIAGFQLSPSGTVIPTASGAIGVIMQPMVNGVAVGPIVVSQQNHSYFLQTYVSAQTWSRFDRTYRTLAGQTFGGVGNPAVGSITFVISDTSIDFPNNPTNTIFTVTGLILPEFALYAVVNAVDLNLAIANTLIGLPPQGGLFVRSLYGPTANQFPVNPPGPELQYLLGAGFQNQIATITLAGDVQQLAFYASAFQTLAGQTLPAVGARIRLQAWEAGVSMARVQDPVAIASEGKIVGDNGFRTAVFRTLNPLPRTSTECDAAGAAAILDRNTVQYQGTYTFDDYFLSTTKGYNPVVGVLTASGYPVPGRYLTVTSPVRGISGLNLLVRRVTTKINELRQEKLNIAVDYGPDYFLDKLLNKFINFTTDVLTPTEIANPPTPQQLTEIGEFYLPNLDNATIVGLLTGTSINIDLGQVPVSGAEVRKTDFGWTQPNKDLILLTTSRTFSLPRKANEEIYYIRQVNGGQFSRFSKVLRLVYPLVPAPPPFVLVDYSAPLAPIISVALPLNTDRNIYGVEIDTAGLVVNPCAKLTLVSDDPTDHRSVTIMGFNSNTNELSWPCVTMTGGVEASNPVTEVIILNGTTPVTTVNTFCLVESITFLNGLFLQDSNSGNWKDSIQLNNTSTSQLVLADSNGANWQDAIVLFAGNPGVLHLSDTMTMSDSVVIALSRPSVLTDTMNTMKDGTATTFAGGGAIQLTLGDDMAFMSDNMVHS